MNISESDDYKRDRMIRETSQDLQSSVYKNWHKDTDFDIFGELDESFYNPQEQKIKLRNST